MRCGVSTDDLDADSLVARIRTQPQMEGADLARTVTTGEVYEAADVVGEELMRLTSSGLVIDADGARWRSEPEAEIDAVS